MRFWPRGVSVIEVKSGYGLDIETELKMLRVAREIEAARDVRVKTSFPWRPCRARGLYKGRNAAYIEEVCLPALEAAARGRAGRRGGRVLRGDRLFARRDRSWCLTARACSGLPVKLHAEQLSHSGGTMLAA